MTATAATATVLAAAIRDGETSSVDLVRACLERCDAVESMIGAWACLDAELALAQARQRDQARQAGTPMGPLHGLPVGIKDIFDTVDMPTENGTVLHAGRRPGWDATAVTRLRAAGAVVMGKTVTTELASRHPGKTRNPHAPEHTPGGSSSGSAAAVGAGMVPLAIGSQTNGSVIRPASYCGVCGFKPTHGLISRYGMLRHSRHLDHVGVFARSVEDLALIAETLAGYDDKDPDCRLQSPPALLSTALQDFPLAPKFAWIPTPAWRHAGADLKDGFAELLQHLGDAVDEAELPEPFGEAYDWHRVIVEADLARSFAKEYERGREHLSATLREAIERGRRQFAVDYNRAVDGIAVLNAVLADVFEWHDVVLTPATAGEAPRGLDSTGDPVFCTPWTLCGMPALTLPLLQGKNGLPIGVQLVAPRGDDGRLLRAARWLMASIAE